MKRTISFMTGKVLSTITVENFMQRIQIRNGVTGMWNTAIRISGEVYHELFDEALDRI